MPKTQAELDAADAELLLSLNEDTAPLAAAHYRQYEVPLLQDIALRFHERGKLPELTLAALRRSAVHQKASVEVQQWAAVSTPELNPGEVWADAFLAFLDGLSPQERQPWAQLLAFARTVKTGQPTAKWVKTAQQHLNAVGAAPYREVLAQVLPRLGQGRSFPLSWHEWLEDDDAINALLDGFNSLTLCGLLRMLPLCADDALTRLLGQVVTTALTPVPNFGVRAPQVSSAAVYALSQLNSDTACAALIQLSRTLKDKRTLKDVQAALQTFAERQGMTLDELLETSVPTLGFTAVGQSVQLLGDVQAHINVDALGTHLHFSRDDQPLKSLPAEVKKRYGAELKQLKAIQQEAAQITSGQARALDRLMIQAPSWKGENWRERYLNHPLTGTVARRLIWLVDGVAACFADGEMRDVNGHTISVKPDSEVKLWHPIHTDVTEVLAWRDRLETLEVRQPFKQAWREVYVLTDAERQTGTYSNRFAAHILKQPQFNALTQRRGWHNPLRPKADECYPVATLNLPAHALRVEYWVLCLGHEYGEDHGLPRLQTHQVCFYPPTSAPTQSTPGGGQFERPGQIWVDPLPLTSIPPLIFTEVMRDADLFISVSSIGNDPTWQDNGHAAQVRPYWENYAFGELTETAQSRAQELKRLLPRLKIKDRLELDGKFLKVRGDRRTYKIHLGSSNILMEPNDQYLCIIPGGKNDGPELDFDGDRVLSLVLSKAFLLADDTKITDPVILTQLGR